MKMIIEASRAETEISGQVAHSVEQQREAALGTTKGSLPVRDIRHVGLPRPLSANAGDRLAQEVLIPTLADDAQW